MFGRPLCQCRLTLEKPNNNLKSTALKSCMIVRRVLLMVKWLAPIVAMVWWTAVLVMLMANCAVVSVRGMVLLLADLVIPMARLIVPSAMTGGLLVMPAMAQVTGSAMLVRALKPIMVCLVRLAVAPVIMFAVDVMARKK